MSITKPGLWLPQRVANSSARVKQRRHRGQGWARIHREREKKSNQIIYENVSIGKHCRCNTACNTDTEGKMASQLTMWERQASLSSTLVAVSGFHVDPQHITHSYLPTRAASDFKHRAVSLAQGWFWILIKMFIYLSYSFPWCFQCFNHAMGALKSC